MCLGRQKETGEWEFFTYHTLLSVFLLLLLVFGWQMIEEKDCGLSLTAPKTRNHLQEAFLEASTCPR